MTLLTHQMICRMSGAESFAPNLKWPAKAQCVILPNTSTIPVIESVSENRWMRITRTSGYAKWQWNDPILASFDTRELRIIRVFVT